MKKLTSTKLLIVFLIFLFYTAFSQSKNEAIIIHPLIGNALDAMEEEYFGLFPDVQNLQNASFFMNPDSTLNAIVSYSFYEFKKDTLIQNFSDFNSINKKINEVIWLEMNGNKGESVNITINKDEVINGQLFSADQKFVYTVKPERLNQLFGRDNCNMLTFTSTNSIKKITIEKSASFLDYFKYVIGGGAIGLGIGLVARFANTSGKNYDGMFGGIAKFTDFMTGLGIGICVGLLGGIITSIIFNTNKNTELDAPSGLSKLNKYTRYIEKTNK